MDMITLAMLNGMKKSGGVGYSETSKVTLTWDGDTSNVINETFVGAVVQVHDKYLNPNNIVGVTLKEHDLLGGKEYPMPQEVFDNRESGEENGFYFTTFEYGDSITLMVLSIPSGLPDDVLYDYGFPSEGVYISATEDIVRISKIHFETETIHPIDKKYLPDMGGGGGLTVVELETPIVLDDTTMLSDADAAKLVSALDAKIPVVFKFNTEENEYSLVCSYFAYGVNRLFYGVMQRREFMFVDMLGSYAVMIQNF